MSGSWGPGAHPSVTYGTPRSHTVLRQVRTGGSATLGVRKCSVLWLDGRGSSPAGRDAAAHFMFVCSEGSSECAGPSSPSDEAASRTAPYQDQV